MKNLLRWILDSERPSVQHERRASFASENGTWFERTGFLSLSALGLLCHLFIFWLLSFPYTYFEQGMCEVNCISTRTGWQTMGTILILPVLPYLACFLPLLRKSMQREEYLEMGLFLNGPVNLIGFLLTFWGLQPFGLEIDLYNTAWHDAAYGLHLALLLFAVVASSVMSMLLRAFLRRSRKLR